MAFTIGFHVSDPLDIVEQTAENIAVWPNPARDILHLDIMDGVTVSVFDMMGRMVMQKRYEGQLDVSGLASGLYAVKAEGCSARFVKSGSLNGLPK